MFLYLASASTLFPHCQDKYRMFYFSLSCKNKTNINSLLQIRQSLIQQLLCSSNEFLCFVIQRKLDVNIRVDVLYALFDLHSISDFKCLILMFVSSFIHLCIHLFVNIIQYWQIFDFRRLELIMTLMFLSGWQRLKSLSCQLWKHQSLTTQSSSCLQNPFH